MKIATVFPHRLLTARLHPRRITPGLLAAVILLPAALAIVVPGAQADTAAAGRASNTPVTVTIDSPAFQQLQLVAFTLQQPSQCVAVASALAVNPVAGDDRRYTFGLALDEVNGNAIPVAASRHTVDFDNPAGEQPDRETVSSTTVFSVSAGAHQIRWMANKAFDATPALSVATSQLSVMCFDTQLQ